MSRFSRWLERGQERTLEPVWGLLKSMRSFLSISIGCQWPVPYQAQEAALIARRALEMLGRMLEPRHRDTSAFFIACLWHTWSRRQNCVFLRSLAETTGSISALLLGSLAGPGSSSGLADALVSVSGEAKCHPAHLGAITRRREKETANCDHMYMGKDG